MLAALSHRSMPSRGACQLAPKIKQRLTPPYLGLPVLMAPKPHGVFNLKYVRVSNHFIFIIEFCFLHFQTTLFKGNKIYKYGHLGEIVCQFQSFISINQSASLNILWHEARCEYLSYIAFSPLYLRIYFQVMHALQPQVSHTLLWPNVQEESWSTSPKCVIP